MKTGLSSGILGIQKIRFGIVAAGLVCACALGANAAAPTSTLVCAKGTTLASGPPDSTIFAREASPGILAFWCERYDENGVTIRTGPYWDVYPNGRPRTQAIYVESRLSGPVTIRNQDGSLFLRAFLKRGEWSGAFEIFHLNGKAWFEARFDSGRLNGPLRTRFPDGALESESHYQNGREDGLARSFYPTAAGGRLKSEVHVEADQIVGQHRLLNRKGELRRSIDWNVGPAVWRRDRSNPAAPSPSTSDRKRNLRD